MNVPRWTANTLMYLRRYLLKPFRFKQKEFPTLAVTQGRTQLLSDSLVSANQTIVLHLDPIPCF